MTGSPGGAGAAGTWFGAHLPASAAQAGTHTALVCADESLTYAALDLAIRRAVTRLGQLGVSRGDRVVIQGTPRPQALIALFAVTRMGAIAVPVHPALTSQELAVISQDTDPRAVIADDAPGTPAPRLPWADLCPAGLSPADPPVPPAGGDIAMIPFTSGTTGRPKGVALTHDNLHWSMLNGLASLPLGEHEVALIATPLAHVAVLGGLPQYTWARRGTVVLAPRFDPGLFIDLVRGHAVTTAFTVPAMQALLARHPRFDSRDLDSLRWVLSGGAPAVPAITSLLRRRGIRVINSYGLTEACAGVTYATGDTDQPTSVGHPVPHVELLIADDRGEPAPDGEVGEILLRGPSIAAAYWTRSGPVPVAEADGWFHTGERGRRDARGQVHVVGRARDTIITGGENVDPAEVENALADLPGVAEVAVCGAPDPVWGELVTAVVVTDGRDLSVQDIRDHLGGRLAKHKWPRRVHAVDALPRGVTGKLQRDQLTRLLPPPA